MLNPIQTTTENQDDAVAMPVRFDANLANLLCQCDATIERLIQLECSLKGLAKHIPDWVNANEAKSMLAINTMAINTIWSNFDADVSNFRHANTLGGRHE